jgi:hypothetical protein
VKVWATTADTYRVRLEIDADELKCLIAALSQKVATLRKSQAENHPSYIMDCQP